MNAIIHLACGTEHGHPVTRFVYRCPDCIYYLEYVEGEDGILRHPTTDGPLYGNKPSDCPHAGKKFKSPELTIRLEEVEG